MIRTVTLLGSSSGRNAGDAALLSGIMDSIDAKLGRRLVYEIPTIRPSYVWHNYNNKVRPVSMLPWSLSVKMAGLPTVCSIFRSDLVMVFDAILFDRSLYNPLFNYLSTINFLLPMAKRLGKKLGFYNVGVGPIKTEAGARMLKRISDLMDFITVRDEQSLQLLRDCGVTHDRVSLTADAAICVQGSSKDEARSILSQHGLTPGEDILAINISKYIDTWASSDAGRTESDKTRSSIGREAFVSILSSALSQVSKTLNVPLAFICTQHHDVPLTREVMEKTSCSQRKAIFTNIDYNHYQIKALLSEVSLLLGMRLHATILATAAFTPAVALPHQPKVQHYFSRLGMDDCVLHFDNFSAESVSATLQQAWQRRTEIRAKLEKVIPELKRQADYAADFVQAIDKGQDLSPLFRKTSELHATLPQVGAEAA